MAAALAPLALAAVGAMAANNVPPRVSTGGQTGRHAITLIDGRDRAEEFPFGNQLDGATRGVYDRDSFDPVRAHFAANQVPGRSDNLRPLRTVFRDPKYELRPDSGDAFQYDEMNRGGTELENQWYYSRLTKDNETPLTLGYLPEYRRSTGILLRNPDTPDMLKPKKRELMEEEVFKAQGDPDRRFLPSTLTEQGRRARNESKYTSGNGALNGFYVNDKPGTLGGPTRGFSTGLEMTREFTGYHPQQRFFRKDDNQRQRNPHELRALNHDTQLFELRSDVEQFTTWDKKSQVAEYHRLAVADGGRQHPHLPHEMRLVELRRVQRDGAPSGPPPSASSNVYAAPQPW
jgi:hypothetical protein